MENKMTNRELLHKKLLEINPKNDLTIVCDAVLDNDEKVNLLLKEILSGKVKTNDDVVLRLLEIDHGHEIRKNKQ